MKFYSVLLHLQKPSLNIEDEKEHIGPVLNTGSAILTFPH